MILAERGGVAAVLAVQQQIDPPLLVARDLAGGVRRGGHETHLLELGGERIGVGRGEFAEFEPVEAHRIDVDMIHAALPLDN